MLLHRKDDNLRSRIHSDRRVRCKPLPSLQERFDEANHRIEKNPIDLEALMQRARALMRMGNPRAAEADLSVIIESLRGKSDSSEIFSAFYFRGICHAKLSCIDEAIADLTAALDIDPSHSRSAYERAACHNRKGNFAAAIADYERALQHDSQHANYLLNRHPNARSRFAKARFHQLSSSLLSSATATTTSLNVSVPHQVDALFSAPAAGSSGSSTCGGSTCGDVSHGKQPSLAPFIDVHVRTPTVLSETLPTLGNPVATPIGSPERFQSMPTTTASTVSLLCGNNEEAEFHHQRGLVYRRKGDLLRAIEEYTSAIALEPKNFKALFNRGFCYNNIGNYSAAICDYEAAMKLEPGYAYTYYNLGISYDRRGGHFKEAIAMFDKAIALDGSNADFYHNRGFSERKLGNYHKAVKDYTTALSIDPKHFKAYYNRAFCYDKLGEATKAIADYTKAISIQGDNPNAYHNRGAALEKIGRLDDSIADYTRAIELDNKSSFTFNARGIVYDRLGNRDAALQDLTQAIFLSPKNSVFYQNRAIVFQNMERFTEALHDYDTSFRLDEEDEKEKKKKPVDNYVSSEDKTDQEPNVMILRRYINRGFCHAREGNYEAAIRDFSGVITADPNNLIALHNRGMCHDKVGNHKQAVRDLSRLIELDAGNADAHFIRGTALESLGEHAMALDDYAVAFNLDVERCGIVEESALSKFRAEHRAAVAIQRVEQLLKR